jgi:anionic cell wall polymer biosynthesis LytR-Cps2A-Psr (LCP) family protein
MANASKKTNFLFLIMMSFLLLGLSLIIRLLFKVTEGAKGGRKKKKSNKKKKKKNKKKKKSASCPPIICTPPPSFAMRQYSKIPHSVRVSINTVVPNMIQTWVKGIFA